MKDFSLSFIGGCKNCERARKFTWKREIRQFQGKMVLIFRCEQCHNAVGVLVEGESN